MTRIEIEALDNEVVTMEQLEAIEEHEDVEELENCGNSGFYVGKTLYCVHFTDGTTIDVCC